MNRVPLGFSRLRAAPTARGANVALLVVFSAALMLSGCEHRAREPGALAPEVVVTSIQNNTTRLDSRSFAGRVLIIHFLASWCAPCVEEIPALHALMDTHGDAIAVLGIGIDDSDEKLREFVKEHGVRFPVGIDHHGLIKRRYQVRGVPESFVVGKDGKLRLVPLPNGEQQLTLTGPQPWQQEPIATFLAQLVRE